MRQNSMTENLTRMQATSRIRLIDLIADLLLAPYRDLRMGAFLLALGRFYCIGPILFSGKWNDLSRVGSERSKTVKRTTSVHGNVQLHFENYFLFISYLFIIIILNFS